MKGLTVKFTDSFWGGLLVGATLTGLLVTGFTFGTIEAHRDFEYKLTKSFFAAIDDVEQLKEKCGELCKNIVLTYPNTTNN